VALVPIIGYLYAAAQLFAVARFTGIALHTGIALLVLSVGVLAARTDVGPVSALASEEPQSVMARRLLVPAVLLPPLLGYVRLTGERHGWYDTGFGLSLMVVGVIVVLSGTIWRTVVVVTRSDEARRQAQRDRDDLLVSERAARERAERADRAKDEFIATLSHELRTPLNAVLGWMQMLQTGAVSEEGRARATDAVARNAGVLARLIDDLIDTSRITAGHLELARELVDVAAVVRAAVESVMPAVEATHVHVSLSFEPSPARVVGDPQRLQQVVWNLLSNAVRFSPTGGSIDVRVSTAGDTVLVRVADEGTGIDPSFLPYVFDRFRQAESTTTRAQTGLGLGLFIAKYLVERHGGTVRAESGGAGTGAVFTIELPAAGDAVSTTALSASMPASASAQQVG
jgi:signal transduction histidine kinase